MIKIEKTSVYNWENAIRGMRNPLNSWHKIDSQFNSDGTVVLGENDLKLAIKLVKGGQPHRKFLRQILVSVDITAPLYWWKEFDTYKVGTTANSTSTMHKIHSREITVNDFSWDKMDNKSMDCLEYIIKVCNELREDFIATNNKDSWYSLIQLLPSSYNQTRTVTMNYEVLSAMYEWRKNHKLDEWRQFCAWSRSLPYGDELIANIMPEQKQKSKNEKVDIVEMAINKMCDDSLDK